MQFFLHGTMEIAKQLATGVIDKSVCAYLKICIKVTKSELKFGVPKVLKVIIKVSLTLSTPHFSSL
jgi:hypothetical protein